MLNNQELTALLRQNGYKVTPQRLAVYEALANTKQHPSAEMLFGTLQPKYPSMSFATVYKTVEILNKLGLIQIINTGEDSFAMMLILASTAMCSVLSAAVSMMYRLSMTGLWS